MLYSLQANAIAILDPGAQPRLGCIFGMSRNSLKTFLDVDTAKLDAAIGWGRADHRTNIPTRVQADILKLNLGGQCRLERLIDKH
jgi:hypothetical protein